MYKLNNRWMISSDKYNWVLTETIKPAAGKPYNKNSYFGTLEQVRNAIINAVAKDSLSGQPITKEKNTSTIKPINLLMENIAKDLELFLQEAINEKAK